MARYKGSLSAVFVEFSFYATTDYAFSQYTSTDYTLLSADAFTVIPFADSASIADIYEPTISKKFFDSFSLSDNIDYVVDKRFIEEAFVTDTLVKTIDTSFADVFSVDDIVIATFTKGFSDLFFVSDSIDVDFTKIIVDTVAVTDTLNIQSNTYDEFINVAILLDQHVLDVSKEESDSVSVIDEVLVIPVLYINRVINGAQLNRSTFG